MVTEMIEEGHIDSETPDVNKTTSLLGAPTTDAESALNNHDQGVGVTESQINDIKEAGAAAEETGLENREEEGKSKSGAAEITGA